MAITNVEPVKKPTFVRLALKHEKPLQLSIYTITSIGGRRSVSLTSVTSAKTLVVVTGLCAFVQNKTVQTASDSTSVVVLYLCNLKTSSQTRSRTTEEARST